MLSTRVNGLLLGILLVALGGCASTPQSAFYTLSAGQLPAIAERPDLALAVGPIALPRYLERPQIVSRGAGNRLRVDEFNRWGGSLDQEISRVLIARLGRGLQTERVFGYPSRVAADVDYRLALDIRRFDGALGGEVTLDVAWSLIADRTAEVIDTRHAAFTSSAGAGGYDAYIDAMNALVTQLAEELIRRLARL